MKKLNTDLIIILLAILFIFGSVFLMFSLEAQEEAVEIRQEQDQIALYLVNNYEGIEKIEFTSFSKNESTGSRTLFVCLNDTDIIDVTFYNFGSDEDYVIGWNQENFPLTPRDRVETQTKLEDVELRYLEENNDK